MDEKYDEAALNHLKKEILNDVKQRFVNEKDKVNLELVKSLKEQTDILKSEIYFLREEMKEKNNMLKMFFHASKPYPQEMALSSSNSKDIIKNHHKNLRLHPVVESPSSFAGLSIRSEKDNITVFQETKAKPEARQRNNFTNNLTEQKENSNKDRSEHSTNIISKEQQQQQLPPPPQQQKQSNTSQLNSKEKPSNDAVNEMSTNNTKNKVFIIGDSMIKKVDGYLLTNPININIL